MRIGYGILALVSLVTGRPAPEPLPLGRRAVTYVDQETGFTFSESRAAATLQSSILYRIATPANVPAGAPYDVVLQVVAPISLGWVGLAWGGGMIRNPLTVAYPYAQKPTVSSRWTTAYMMPQPYTGATYTQLNAGNRVNATHWQYTVKCSGCTTWTGSSGQVRIDPTSSRRLAFACTSSQVSTPSSNTSTIPVHQVTNYFTHDFSAGANADFAGLLERNGVPAAGGGSGNASRFWRIAS